MISEQEYAKCMQNKRELCIRTDSFSVRCYDFMEILIRQVSHINDEAVFSEITEPLQKYILTSGIRS